MSVVTRFAPSPTGYLHIGSALMGLLNFLFAKANNGKFLLRVEDTDKARSTEEAKQAILDSMKWLELDWDDDVIYQSSRANRHKEAALQLLEAGGAYYCFSSQDEISAAREDAIAKKESFIFRSPWRDAAPSTYPKDIKPTLRLKAPREGEVSFNDLVQGEITVENDHLDDMILLRSDGTPTYMLAVVVDDHDMGVTHIIRGDDHLTNGSRQIALYNAFGWDIPQMAHVPLIHGPDGAKLSKRHGAVGVHTYKDQGYLPEAMCNCLLRLGWSHGDDEIISRAQAIEWFDIAGIGKSPARIDFDKLLHLNAHYIHEYDNDQLLQYIHSVLKHESFDITAADLQRISKALNSIKKRCHLLTELAPLAKLYLPGVPEIESEHQAVLTNELNPVIDAFIEMLKSLGNLEPSLVQESCKTLAVSLDLKLGKLMNPIRILMTGSNKSPSLFEMISIIGKDETIERLCRKT